MAHGDTLSMNMPAIKTEPVTMRPTTASPVVAMTPKRPPRAEKYVKMARETAARVVPPLIVLALLMLFWELACRRAGSTLPPPSRVYKDTKELIFDPFFDRGGIDKGLFWHLSASLQRVALGYSLAAVAGVALGTLVGQSVWAMRGLDPLEFFTKIMIPAAAPYIFTGLRIGIGLSWLAIVAAEMLIGGVGIGFFIWDAWNSSHISEIILALFYVGIIGFVLDRIIAGLGKIVTRGTALN